MSIWDEADMRPDSNYVKFESVGDKCVGTIDGIAIHTFQDGKRAPKLYIRDDDGEVATLTAGQFELKTKLAELRPEVGDRIAIVYTSQERLEGGKTLKRFDVQVKRNGGAAAPVPASAVSSSAVSADELL